MEFFRARELEEAVEYRAAHPGCKSIFGGTDVMVELNFDRSRPESVLDLTGVEWISEWERVDGRLRVGAGVSYSRIISELGGLLPGLAMASRTVGSPQIRNRGTVGGNLGSASPAGDALPPLYAADAEVELVSPRGTRTLPVTDFITGPKRNALEEDELISAFYLPEARGPQQYSKIGPRNAMVIAVCACGLSLDAGNEKVTACLGSAGPTPLRAHEAERFMEGVMREEGLWESREPIREAALVRFGDLVADAARPITDVRATEAYRRHAVGVLGRRALGWAWEEYGKGDAYAA
ncbi:FAD binding domain-containing protein [Rubrobacter aplysinae]|uniref:FAD binding domain-containing protein n=1 Tax=Rubrobacter aplysinae TaxID=909625 RepID=UPI00064BF29E|nr:FAD binding domain-containing protein [Rubrobacter aplysinae]